MTRKQHNIPDYEQIVRDNYAKALDIDSLPMDGVRHQQNTAFQARRREQVVFLQNIWPQFFTDRIPTSREAHDIMGLAKTNSVADVLECLAHGAAYQHKGRGVVRRDRAGNPMKEKIKDGQGNEIETEKIRRTKRKINNSVAYMKAVVRRMLGDVSDTTLPPEHTSEAKITEMPNRGDKTA